MNAVTGKPWKGLLALLIVWEAGQFLSGSRWRGLIWRAIALSWSGSNTKPFWTYATRCRKPVINVLP